MPSPNPPIVSIMNVITEAYGSAYGWPAELDGKALTAPVPSAGSGSASVSCLRHRPVTQAAMTVRYEEDSARHSPRRHGFAADRTSP